MYHKFEKRASRHTYEYPAVVTKEREVIRRAITAAAILDMPLPDWIAGFASTSEGRKCPVARPTAWGGYRGRVAPPRQSQGNVEPVGGISDE